MVNDLNWPIDANGRELSESISELRFSMRQKHIGVFQKVLI